MAKPKRKPRRKASKCPRPERNYIRDCWEAAAREEQVREAVFSGAPYFIEGVEVRLMTLRDLLAFLREGNPFFKDGDISPEAVCDVLWKLSPNYSRDERARIAFIHELGPLTWDHVKGIAEYIDVMFMDKPGSGEDGPVLFSFVASIVDFIASEYGWTRDVILDSPVPWLFQEMRAAVKRHGGTVVNRWYARAQKAFLVAINQVPVEHRDEWQEIQLAEMRKEAANGS